MSEDYEDSVCRHSGNVTWQHRVDNPVVYDWCVVPETSFDVLFVPGIAVVLACLLQNRQQTTLVLIIGGILMGLQFPVNLGRWANSVSIWLGIQPYELFFYIFLPPLLFDAAVRIDFYLFKKVLVQVMTLAFLVVIGSVGLMMPIMLYIFNLHASGWTWQYVGLFASMLASTDAVAIISTMKTHGGPARLRTVLEGESLLNDASGITLFTIFLAHVEEVVHQEPVHDTFWSVLGNIVGRTCWLAFGGFLMGLAFGIVTLYLIRYMRSKGAGIDQQVGLTFAMAYMSYYIASAPAGVSGVISVAVFGLFGAATSRWDMHISEEGEVFESFWDTLSFAANAIVFFFSGLACVNFAVRSSENLDANGQSAVLASTIWRFPLIYLVLFAVRFLLILLFSPLFKVLRSQMTFKEIIFATAAGLRGSVSLILAQGLISDADARTENPDYQTPEEIKAEIVLWTAGFVLMTLVINASILPWVLRVTGLSKVAPGKLKQRKRVVRALLNHTGSTIQALKDDDDEMLRGVDWPAVEQFTITPDDYEHFKDPSQPPPPRFEWGWPPSWRHRQGNPFYSCFDRRKRRKGKASGGLESGFGGDDSVKFFGRRGNVPLADDLESGISAYSNQSGDAVPVSPDPEGSDPSDSDPDLDDNDDQDGNASELPFLSRTTLNLTSRSNTTGDIPSSQRNAGDLSRSSFSFQNKDEAPPKSRWLRKSASILRWPGADPDRDFQSGPAPLDKHDEDLEDQPDPKLSSNRRMIMQQPSMTNLVTPFAAPAKQKDQSSPEDRDREDGVEMVSVNLEAGDKDVSDDKPSTSSATPEMQRGDSEASTPGEHVEGTMTGPTFQGRAAPPQATQVVLVRGVPLPMPQPDCVECGSYSPNVTPESATLMRLAKSLAHHQGPGGTQGPHRVVRGTNLATLNNVPSGSSWPNAAGESNLRRPPLPWRASNPGMPKSGSGASLQGADSPETSMGRANTALANQLRNHLSMQRAETEARPSLFQAFPELRQPAQTPKHAERHKHLLDAFKGLDRESAFPAGKEAQASTGTPPRTPPKRSFTTAHADNERTWTAGMTKGRPPAELQAQLQQFRLMRRSMSAPRSDQEASASSDKASGSVPQHNDDSFDTAARGGLLNKHSRGVSWGQGDNEADSSAAKGTSEDGLYDPNDTGTGDKQLRQHHHVAEAVHMTRCPLTDDELAEARVRLVVGFKRYFHGKRIEGLLSSRGLRILDNACDAELEHPERPLSLWTIIDKDASGRVVVHYLAHGVFLLRRANMKLRQRNKGGWKWWEWIKRHLALPFQLLIRLVHWQLSKLMLLGLEVAMEYMLALLHSPQVQLLRHHDALRPLQEEVRQDLQQVCYL
ncbi:hypothetical protein WJX73_003859 [Symbiochloris irregularis]|uniref:Cation/H+ exchanger transmembrane domain-containing protein n=1 Tax=Symbiochloris irregularis TaxID=706552 RepID=A0AAW1NP82_9CHLO